MNITGIHNLQILRGLKTNRSILSCKDDGSLVDLWHVNDGSGRQKWKIVATKDDPNVYNIIAVDGLTSKRKYLSCNIEGTKVDLWNIDDGSGRQRWEFKPVDESPTSDTYLIQVKGGCSSDRKYLSCNDEGAIVDLWNIDDGSGRQRWQLQWNWQA